MRSSLLVLCAISLASVVSCDFTYEKPLAPADVKRVVQPGYVTIRLQNDPKVLMDLRDFHLDSVEVHRLEPSDIHTLTLFTNAPGNEKLRALTAANVGKQVEIYLDNQLISSPSIESEIERVIVLNGNFSKSQAEEIAARVRRGGAA